MRRHSLLRNGLIAALLTASLSLSAGAASFGVGVVHASALRLRAKPNTSSAILTQAYRGSSVDVLADAVDGWYQVNVNGKVGYMSAEYLTVTPLVVTPQPEETPSENKPVESKPEENKPTESKPVESEPVENTPTEDKSEASNSPDLGRVTLSRSSNLSIRSGSGTGYKRLGLVPNGTVLTLNDFVNGWYLITYNGITGYVSGEYIKPVAEYDPASGAAVVTEAMKYLGYAYVYGGSSPKGFDCSGFTSYIYRQFGYTINRTASSQLSNGVPIAYADLQPGDLVFFKDHYSTSAASHVGIYIGDGNFIHAENSRSCVKVTPLSQSWYANRYIGARRIL